MKGDEILPIIIDFIEENWASFISKLEEHLPEHCGDAVEEEAEEAMEDLHKR